MHPSHYRESSRFFFDKIEVSPTPLKFDSHVEEENPVIKNFIDECHEFEIVEE